MMKLSSIRIQGMHNVSDKTYQLGRMNYFRGPNGVGKSTVMQAIQLALLGYIPGTDKKKSAIFHHSNGHHMSVELVLEGGSNKITINRTWTRKGKDIVATVNTVPEDIDIEAIIGELALPILNFNDFIGMTSNKLKDWFINFLPSADSDIDWNSRLRAEIESYGTLLSPEFVTETIQYVTNLKSEGVERIREFNAYLKQEQSCKKAELTRVQGTIQSLIYYDDCDNSADVSTLTEQNRIDAMHKDNISHQLTLLAQNNNIHAQLRQLTDVTMDSLEADGRYVENIQNIAAADKAIDECTESITSWSAEVASRKQQIADKQKVINGAGVCPYSGTVCEAIAKMIDVFKSDVELLSIEIDTYLKKIDVKNAELATARQQKSSCERHNSTLAAQYTKSDALNKQLNKGLDGLNEEMLIKNRAELEDSIAKRNELIIKLEANKKYNELTKTLTAQKFQLEQELEIIKDWIKLTDVNGMQSTIMDAPFKNLAGTMSEYLRKFFERPDLTAAFHLTQEANSFSFGIRDERGVYIEFDLLSSGEKCLYTLSLLLSLIETANTHLPLILIDDLLDHLDANRIQACFETLYDINTVQVLLAGVQECSHENAADFVVEV